MTLPRVLVLIGMLTILGVKNQEIRWGILSTFPRPMPVMHNAQLFPRFFTSNDSLDLPYLPKDEHMAAMQENVTFPLKGTLCFILPANTSDHIDDCMILHKQLAAWFEQRGNSSNATLSKLRLAIVQINSTRLDISVTNGLFSWMSSAFSYFKEWVGVGMFGTTLFLGLFLCFWLLCRFKRQQHAKNVAIVQAMLAVEQGASPQVWLSMLSR